MKYIMFFTTCICFMAVACKNDPKDGVQEIRGGSNAEIVRNPIGADQEMDTSKLARITFEEIEFDFGTVNEGVVVDHNFKFKNTGAVPLVISNCRSSCGCTIPEWPKEAIPPGGSGEINARFNTENKIKNQRKLIYVTANTYPNETKVMLKGIVNE